MQARLGWTLRLDKTTDFVGKKALIEQRDNRDWRRLVGLELLEQGIPRRGQIVFDAVGEVVGEVSSGTYSPTLKRGIALCYVERGNGKKGTALQIEIRGKRKRVQVASLPFVPARVKSG